MQTHTPFTHIPFIEQASAQNSGQNVGSHGGGAIGSQPPLLDDATLLLATLLLEAPPPADALLLEAPPPPADALLLDAALLDAALLDAVLWPLPTLVVLAELALFVPLAPPPLPAPNVSEPFAQLASAATQANSSKLKGIHFAWRIASYSDGIIARVALHHQSLCRVARAVPAPRTGRCDTVPSSSSRRS
jgi:hypothetical protein